MAIYTRTGDSGSTSLFTGQRVSKTHLRVETYGTLDELNATLSLCYCATAIESHRILLEAIQQQIFWFSAELASESEQPSAQQRYIGTEEIAALENAIDSAMNAVPPVHSFILPGRCEAASRMHFARTVARRAERRLVELTTETTVRNVLLHYINRLSDCLYALARVEDNVAHQNLMIQEITKTLSRSQPHTSIEGTHNAAHFTDLHQLIRSAAMRADELHIPVVISIVHANGTESVTWRMPDALLVSSELAPKKAWTAVAMKTATHKLADTVQPGTPLYALESHMQGKVVTLGGALPSGVTENCLAGLASAAVALNKTWILLKAQWRQLTWE